MKTMERSADLDHKAMLQSMSWHNTQLGPVHPYLPSSRELDTAFKWPIPQGYGCQVGMHGEARDSTRFGLLPSITQLIYDASLPDKSKGDIEHEMREASRRESHRLFDTSGYCR